MANDELETLKCPNCPYKIEWPKHSPEEWEKAKMFCPFCFSQLAPMKFSK